MKLMSVKYGNQAFNIAMFVLRVSAGLLMLISHGYDKLDNFSARSAKFTHFLGMSSNVSLSLSLFAEFFCSLLVILGLFTRLACVPLLIDMAVAVGLAHNYDVLKTGEKAVLFFVIFLTILFVGPGRFSVDGMIKK